MLTFLLTHYWLAFQWENYIPKDQCAHGLQFPHPHLYCDRQITGGLRAFDFSSDYRAHKLYLRPEWMILEQVWLASVNWWGSSFHLVPPTSGSLHSSSGFGWECNSLFPPVWGHVLTWVMSGSQRWLSCAPTVGSSLGGIDPTAICLAPPLATLEAHGLWSWAPRRLLLTTWLCAPREPPPLVAWKPGASRLLSPFCLLRRKIPGLK